MGLIRHIKAFGNYLRWRYIDKRPVVIKDEWYNAGWYMPDGNRLVTWRGEEWVEPKVGEVYGYIFRDGGYAAYKITAIHKRHGDWLRATDKYHVDLKLCGCLLKMNKE